MADKSRSFPKLLKSRLWPIAWRVFGRLFVMLGLALLAWGFDDLRGFLSNPARVAFAALVVIQLLVHAWLLIRIPARPDVEDQPELEHWHYSVMELIFILAAFGDRRNLLTWAENPALRWDGLGIYLLGSALSTWANWTWVEHLRRRPESALDHPVLLAEGPYYWIRYPNLPIIFFYALGFALLFRSWVGLVLLIPLAWILFRRLEEWETLNAQRYRKIWALRCHTSKRVIPFLY